LRSFFLLLRFLSSSRFVGVVCPCFTVYLLLREEMKKNVRRVVVTFPPYDEKIKSCKGARFLQRVALVVIERTRRERRKNSKEDKEEEDRVVFFEPRRRQKKKK